MNSWFSVVLGGEDSLVGKQLNEANSLNLWLWDYERVFYCCINLEIAASMGIEMSKDDFCQMLLELVTSPKARKTVLSWTDSSLNFKSVMKVGFANFSWTFVMDRLSSKETKVVVHEFIKILGWPNDMGKQEPTNDAEKQETPIEIIPIEEQEPQLLTVLSSQNFSSDSALAILMELKDEAALSNAALNQETPKKVEPTPISSLPATPSTKEAQKRKELEDLTAAKTKKPRRFI